MSSRHAEAHRFLFRLGRRFHPRASRWRGSLISAVGGVAGPRIDPASDAYRPFRRRGCSIGPSSKFFAGGVIAFRAPRDPRDRRGFHPRVSVEGAIGSAAPGLLLLHDDRKHVGESQSAVSDTFVSLESSGRLRRDSALAFATSGPYAAVGLVSDPSGAMTGGLFDHLPAASANRESFRRLRSRYTCRRSIDRALGR